MRFYTRQHKHYCGIDLHARTMYLCILDQAGEILLYQNIRCDPAHRSGRRNELLKVREKTSCLVILRRIDNDEFRRKQVLGQQRLQRPRKTLRAIARGDDRGNR